MIHAWVRGYPPRAFSSIPRSRPPQLPQRGNSIPPRPFHPLSIDRNMATCHGLQMYSPYGGPQGGPGCGSGVAIHPTLDIVDLTLLLNSPRSGSQDQPMFSSDHCSLLASTYIWGEMAGPFPGLSDALPNPTQRCPGVFYVMLPSIKRSGSQRVGPLRILHGPNS